MVEMLRLVLDALVVASLAVIAAFVVMFVAVATWTVLSARRRDPLADELDAVLDEILAAPAPGKPARSRIGWHR